MSKLKCAIVVGASSGIGAEVSKQLARHGYRVALIARSEDKLRALAAEIEKRHEGRALVFPHDVTNYAEVPNLFQEVTRELGGFDLIVYSSGVMPPVAIDEFNFDKDKLTFEVNVLGAMAWLNEAAIRCQRQKTGTIVGIGSVAGDRGRSPSPVYSASKAAIHTYLEGLRNRFGHGRVRVITIKPGPVETPMTAGLKMPFMISAEKAGEQIYRAIAKRKQRAYVPIIWWPIMTVIRAIPSFIFKATNI